MVNQAEAVRDPKTGFYPTQIWPLAGKEYQGRMLPPANVGTQPIVAAVGILEAAAWLDTPQDAKHFSDVASDMAMVNIDAYGKWDGRTHTRPLSMWVGDGVGWSILEFYQLAGRPAKVMELLTSSAQAAAKDWRPTTITSSGELGRRILFYVQMYLDTAEPAYL
jgi:hypothetical protein